MTSRRAQSRAAVVPEISDGLPPDPPQFDGELRVYDTGGGVFLLIGDTSAGVPWQQIIDARPTGILTADHFDDETRFPAQGDLGLQRLAFESFAAMPGDARLHQLGLPLSPVNFNGQRATGVGTPTQGSDAVTKLFMESWNRYRLPVRAATTAAISRFGEQTIDNVALLDGDWALVKDQGSSASTNGVYRVRAGTNWELVYDFPAVGEMVMVRQGTVNGGGLFLNVRTELSTTLATYTRIDHTQPLIATHISQVDARIAALVVDATSSVAGKIRLAGDLGGTASSPTVVDATTSSKGKIQLGGDLAGTAASPTVPGLSTRLTQAQVDARIEALRPNYARGVFQGNSGASGLINIAHGLGVLPASVQFTGLAGNQHQPRWDRTNSDATNIRVQVRDQTGTLLSNGTATGFSWYAVL